jgi:ABC-type bacteriocin/lantibiotic exporter with double-glycine peptidase domain
MIFVEMNKESQLQQAEWYSLSLKLRNNCRKLRSVTPSLSNKRAFLGKLILVGLVIAVLALGTSIYFKMRNGGVRSVRGMLC